MNLYYAHVIAGYVLLLALLAIWPTPAHPQTHEGHAEFHDVYKTWTQPGTTAGCCNAKYDGEGNDVGGDCYPTVAWPINGTWYAYKDDGDVIAIPDDKVVRQINPDPSGSRAHLCFNYGRVLCFVPPFGGM